MKTISNNDYHKAQRLLRNLAGRKADNLRDCNASREAGQLLRKWQRRNDTVSDETLPGVASAGIPGKDFIPVEWVDACEKYGKWKIVKQEQPEVRTCPGKEERK